MLTAPTRTLIAAFAAAVALSATADSVPAASSPWITKANATCRAWEHKANVAFGPNPSTATPAAVYKLLLKARPIETGELHALKAIPGARPAGANKAFHLVALDIQELDTAITAYRAGRQTTLLRAVAVWQSDRRAGLAFRAIGAKDCEPD